MLLAALLAVSVFAGVKAYDRLAGSDANTDTAPTFVPAVRSNITSSVSATGTVQAVQQVTLTFDIGQGSGKIKEMLVKLGDKVVTGQPLARLDDSDLQQALRSAQTGLSSAQARYDAALEGPTTSEIASAKQAVLSATSQRDAADQELLDLLDGPSSADVTAAQQAVLSAQNSLQSAKDAQTKAKADLTSAQSESNAAAAKAATACTTSQSATTAQSATGGSSSSGTTGGGPAATSTPTSNSSSASSSSTTTTACTDARASATKAAAAVTSAQSAASSSNLSRAVTNAELSLKTSQDKYNATRAGATAAEIQAARNALESAKASVESAQAKYDDLFKAPSAEVTEPLRASVDQAKADVSTAEKNLAAATITAPFDGQISQLTGEVGTQVSSTTGVFILLNPDLVRIDATVDQAYISQLKSGQNATATFDAIAGQQYRASISAVGLTPTVQQGVVSYVVTLAVDTSRLTAAAPVPTPGMTASLTVTTSSTENALVVPTRAVRRIGRNQTVTVKTPEGSEQRVITTGATSGTVIEVLSGLSDGDEVQVMVSGSSAAGAGTTGQQRTNAGGSGPVMIGGPPP